MNGISEMGIVVETSRSSVQSTPWLESKKTSP